MPARNANLTVTAQGKDRVSGPMRQAARSFAKAADQAVNANKRTQTSLQRARRAMAEWNQAIQFVTSSLRPFVNLMEEAINLATTQQDINIQLRASMSQLGEVTEQAFRRQKLFAESIQATIGISNEEIEVIGATLAALGVRNELLEIATKQSIGWAKVLGKDVKSAAVDVAKAYGGNIQMLQRYDRSIKTVDDAFENLNRKWDIAISLQGSFATESKRADENLADLKKTLGEMAIETDGAAEAMTSYANILLGLDITLKENKNTLATFRREWIDFNANLIGVEVNADELNQTLQDSLGPVALFKRFTVLGQMLDAFDEKGTKATETARALSDAGGFIGPSVDPEALRRFEKEQKQKEKLLDDAEKKRKAAAKKTREAKEKALEDAAVDELQTARETAARLSAIKLQQLEDDKEFLRLGDEERVARFDAALALVDTRTDESMENLITGIDDAAASFGETFSSSIGSAIVNARNLGDVLVSTFKSVLGKLIGLGIFQLLSLLFTGGIGGLFAGLTAGVGAFGRHGYMAPRFQGGGVTEGAAGPDNRLVAVGGGEGILPAGLTDWLRDVLTSRGPAAPRGGGFQDGGVVAAGGGGLTVIIQGELPRSETETELWSRDVLEPVLRRRGVIP